MSKYLVAVDPGLATGVAFLDITDDENPLPLWSAELSIEEFYVKMEELFDQYAPDITMVWEAFHITVETAKKSPQPWSLHLIGVMYYWSWKFDASFRVNSPSQKSFASNERLRQVGFWHVGGEGHANDAYRHAMIYLAETKPKWVRKLIMPTN